MCLFTSQLSLVGIAPTHGGMARLSWPGWLVTYWDGFTCPQTLTHPGTNRIRWSECNALSTKSSHAHRSTRQRRVQSDTTEL